MKNFSLKTKGNFPLNSKERGGRGYLVWIIVACVVLVLFKDTLGNFSQGLSTPFFALRNYINTSSATVPVFIRSRMELLDQIHALEQEVARETGADATLVYIMAENNELKALLGATSTPRIVAGVVGRPPFTPYDTVVLDRGSDAGIVQYAPVYHGTGVAIGYVRSVTKDSALVTLFSSPGVESTVYVFGPNLFTTAYGEGGGVIRLSVPQGIVVEKGNVVVLPSLDSGSLGIISEIQSIPTEPEQHAYVTMSTPIQSIRLVSVGTRPVQKITLEEAKDNVTEEERRLFMFDVPDDERMQEPATSTPEVATSSASTSDISI